MNQSLPSVWEQHFPRRFTVKQGLYILGTGQEEKEGTSPVERGMFFWYCQPFPDTAVKRKIQFSQDVWFYLSCWLKWFGKASEKKKKQFPRTNSLYTVQEKTIKVMSVCLCGSLHEQQGCCRHSIVSEFSWLWVSIFRSFVLFFLGFFPCCFCFETGLWFGPAPHWTYWYSRLAGQKAPVDPSIYPVPENKIACHCALFT